MSKTTNWETIEQLEQDYLVLKRKMNALKNLKKNTKRQIVNGKYLNIL